MCLAVPGKILTISGDDPISRVAMVSFGGVTKEINLAYLPEAKVDDYVIVHVGFALSIVAEQEATEALELLTQLNEMAQESELAL